MDLAAKVNNLVFGMSSFEIAVEDGEFRAVPLKGHY